MASKDKIQFMLMMFLLSNMLIRRELFSVLSLDLTPNGWASTQDRSPTSIFSNANANQKDKFFYLKHSPNFVKVFTREGLSNLWNELVKDGELTAVNNR